MSKRNKFDDLKWCIEELEIDSLPDDMLMMVLGPRRSGKGVVIEHIMKYNNPDRTIAFMGSTDAINQAKAYIPHIYVQKDLSLLNFFLTRHKEKQEQKGQEFQQYLDEEEERTGEHVAFDKDDPRGQHKAAWYFDDVGHFKKVMNGPDMSDLAINGRHAGKVVLASQHLKLMPPVFRNNVDVLVLTKVPSQKVMKQIYEDMTTCFASYNNFVKLTKRITQGFSVMVINRTALKHPEDESEDIEGVSDVERKVSFFTADPNFMPGFVIGDEEYRGYNDAVQASIAMRERENNKCGSESAITLKFKPRR
jgi:hypothetical protein